jgi:nitronate monooxygenase
MCTKESPIHEDIKRKIVESTERDTVLMFRPLRNTARVARNAVSEEVVRILDDGGTFPDVQALVSGARGKTVYEKGDPEAGVWSVGMVQGLINDIPSSGELIDRIMADAQQLLSKYSTEAAAV